MRYFIFLLVAFTFVSCSNDAARAGNPYAITVSGTSMNDSMLYQIEDRIMQKFVNSMARTNIAPMDELIAQLDQGYAQHQQNLFRYWQAYALFYKSIYHAQVDEMKAAEKATDRAIDLLQDLNEKTSEDFALLGFLQGFSIQFKAGVRAPFISGKSSKNAKIALEMQPDNPRAYYVLGNNDYYTPTQFGGGQEVVAHLEKAISLAEQQPDNPYLPSWGAEDAYEMLIRYYDREGEEQKAREAIDRALDAFPDSYRLNELAGKLSK